MLISKLNCVSYWFSSSNGQPLALSDWLENIKVTRLRTRTPGPKLSFIIKLSWSMWFAYFLGFIANKQQLWEGYWESIYSLLLWPIVTRTWPETPGIVTTIGHVNNLYQMSSNVTFQLYTPPKFSTLRQIHKSENPPKNSGRGHSAINLITNFARGWFPLWNPSSKWLWSWNWKVVIDAIVNLNDTVSLKY